MPADLRITTEMLYQGALFFAVVDALLVPLLVRRVDTAAFRSLRWALPPAAGLVWFGIWSWAIGNFWETVYVHVFPAWARVWAPWIALGAAALCGAGLWALVLRLPRRAVLAYCLMGGMLGVVTHIWAVVRGIVTRPPMLQGASPLAAVVIAFFEYTFYWCVILLLAWMCQRVCRYFLPERRGTIRL